jgi:hypothetical protein
MLSLCLSHSTGAVDFDHEGFSLPSIRVLFCDITRGDSESSMFASVVAAQAKENKIQR